MTLLGGRRLGSAAGRIAIGPDDGQSVVVTLVGDIDLDVASDLRLALQGIDAPKIVVDMSATTFIDSVTVGTLIVAARREDTSLTIRGLTAGPLRVLQQAGVADLFELED